MKYIQFIKTARQSKAVAVVALCFVLQLFATGSFAQQYPVQGTLAINSPYPAYLSDYANASIEKLILNLTLTDVNLSNKRIRLKLFIQKQNSLIAQSTDNITGEPTIILDGGIPQRFTSAELATYFKVENLQGITADAYSQPLPEGSYTIGFEVYDYFTGNKLSSRISQLFWLMLNDPPLLNMPRNHENILETSPNNPQIVFQWTPRTTQVTNTEYEFTLAELWDDAGDPYQQFLAAIPKYQTTTSNTTLLYGITEPPLLAGRTYGWRVRAKGKAGFEDIGLYRQNGYSEIFIFKYAGQCAAVQGITIEVKGYDHMYITWQPNPNQSLYKVAYRKYTPGNNWEWHETESFNAYANLTNLEANTEYEIKVGGVCSDGLVSYSIPQTKRTLQSGQISGINCGQVPVIDLSNQVLVERLNAGDVVMANDFPITLIRVEGNKNGWNGEGWVKIPWLADTKIKVRYSGIKVNTDKRLIDGFFETTYDPTGANIGDVDQLIEDLNGIFTGGTDVGHVVTGSDTTAHTVNFDIPDPCSDCSFNGDGHGGGTINFGGGKTLTVDKVPTTIKDANGDIYQIDKDGHVTKIGNAGGGGLIAAVDKNKIDLSKGRVDFAPADGMVYAFDAWQQAYDNSNAWAKKYEKLNGGDYRVSAKAIAPGKPDKVLAKIILTDNTLKADSIKFVNGKGTVYEKKKVTATDFEITITGGPAGDAQEIYALYPQGTNKPLNLGKLLVASYGEQNLNIILVPVNGAKGFDKEKISDSLNLIYNPLNIKVRVAKEENFENHNWDINANGVLDVEGSGYWSSLTAEMKALNNEYRNAASSIDNSAVYLFVLNQLPVTSNGVQISGDMPRGKQFGYLFVDGSNTNGIEKNAAHEIGHGIFKLRHLSEYGDIGKGKLSPLNVMDYPVGKLFSKYQWDIVHDPGLVIGVFENDEGVMSLNIKEDGIDKNTANINPATYYYQPSSGERMFMSPAGKLVVFSQNSSLKNLHFKMCEKDGPDFYPLGCLLEFTLDNISYGQLFASSTRSFCHYSRKDKISQYLETTPRKDELLDKFTFDYSRLMNGQEYNAVVIFQHPSDYTKAIKSIVKIRHDGKPNGRANDINNTNGFVNLAEIKNRPEAQTIALSAPTPCNSVYEKTISELQDDIGTLTYSGAIDFKTLHTVADPLRNKIVNNIAFYINKIGSPLYTQLKEKEGTWGLATDGNREYLDYLAFLKRFWTMLQKTGADAASIDDPDLIVKYYWEKWNEFKSLKEFTRAWSVEDRLKVLNTISKGNVSGGGNWFAYMLQETGLSKPGYGMEEFAIDIISNTPESDWGSLCNGIVKNHLLFKLIDKIDNTGLGENNFDLLFDNIIKFTEATIKANPASITTLAQQKRIYLWKTQFFTNDPTFKAELLGSGKVKITTNTISPNKLDEFLQELESNNFTIPVAGQPENSIPDAMQSKISESSIELDPYTPVLLLLGEAPPNAITAFENKTMIIVPAVALDWLWRTNHTRIWKQWGSRTVNVGLTALSFGAWGAVNTTGKVIIAANAVLTAGDLFVSESHISDELKKTVAGRRFMKIFYTVQAVTAVADVATAVTGLQRNADEFIEAYQEAKKITKADGSKVIEAGSEIEKTSDNFYDLLIQLGFTAKVTDKLAAIEGSISTALQKIGTLYDKTKITLKTVKEGSVLKLKQVSSYGEFVLTNIDGIGRIISEEVRDWLKIKTVKYFGKEQHMPVMAMADGSSVNAERFFAKTTEYDAAGQIRERIRLLDGNPNTLREAANVMRKSFGIGDELYNHAHFQTILQKFIDKGVDGMAEAEKFMQDIKDLGVEAQLLEEFKNSSRGAYLRDILKENPGDLDVYKAIKDNPSLAFEYSANDFGGLPKEAQWRKWGGAEYFKQITQEGRLFNTNVINEWNKTGRGIFGQIAKQQGVNINDYHIFTEVQLTTTNGYMKADALLVKYNSNDEIIDVILIENKLSKGTDYTIRQKEAFKILKADGKIKVNYPADAKYNSNYKLEKGKEINIAQSKAIKIHDEGSASGQKFIENIDYTKF